MDTTDPEIQFDEEGVCNHCRTSEALLNSPPYSLNPEQKTAALNRLVFKIKRERRNRRYDCIIGVSGGVDSTYTAYVVKKLGLRPLAVHLDNGWDSELAVNNIENICRKLEIDLFTYVIDWEEFRDLQLSFLKASTPDSEIPSDHAIQAIMTKTAMKERARYILAGTNLASESIMPRAWSQGHGDWRYIKCVQSRFGSRELKSFPHFTLFDFVLFRFVWRLRWINILDYCEYDRETAKKLVEKELGWRDYGQKHHESIYTRFFQLYILPRKFGYDKRRAHLSSLVIAGQMTREQALQAMKRDPYPSERLREDMEYVINKLGITREEFQGIMASPKRSYSDYPNYRNSSAYRLLDSCRSSTVLGNALRGLFSLAGPE
jgi:N-acetyl sugar amidotransferase